MNYVKRNKRGVEIMCIKLNYLRIWVDLILVCLIILLSTSFAFASDLNGIGSGTTVVSEETVTPSTTPSVPATDSDMTITEGVGSPIGSLPESNQSPDEVQSTANAVGSMFNHAGPNIKDVDDDKVIETVESVSTMAIILYVLISLVIVAVLVLLIVLIVKLIRK